MTASSRRGFLLGAGASALTVGAGAVAVAGVRSDVDGAPSGRRGSAAIVPFAGDHQAGIVAQPAAAGVVVGLDVRVHDRAALVELLRTISSEIELVMSGEPYERRGGGYPPLDTGVLGPRPGPTGTSVILSVGRSLFDERYGLANRLPEDLIEMPRFANDRLVTPERSHGDLALVVQAATADASIHAVRQVLRRTRGELKVRWLREGYNTLDRQAGPGEAPGRNLMGFKDGTANLAVDDAAVMDAHVWIQPGDGQPGWATGGSFQAIRAIRMLVEFWDRTRLSEQETVFGRRRDSGAPIGGERETDVPDVSRDLESHIARANARRPGGERHLMLRRPFSYVGGLDENDQLDQGLLFTCYQRSLRDGFLTVQQRLDGERLEEYVRPLGGGCFLALPGPGDGYLGWQLVD